MPIRRTFRAAYRFAHLQFFYPLPDHNEKELRGIITPYILQKSGTFVWYLQSLSII